MLILKKTHMKIKLLIIGILLTLCSTNVMPQPDQTINSNFNFEIEKYLGTWYEIARFDHRFERGLQGVTATYSLKKDGKIEVLNQGLKGGLDGKLKKAKGKARMVSEDTPRQLEVSFFLWFYSPYNILELDPGYNYALIGSNSANYLWILSRSPQLDEGTIEKLLTKARERGYETDNLIWVEHASK
jgi:lipocalin